MREHYTDTFEVYQLSYFRILAFWDYKGKTIF